MRSSRVQDGATLVELLVVLAVLGVVGGIAGLAFTAPAWRAEDDLAWRNVVVATRREAVATARPATVELMVDGVPVSVTALPDGRVIADPALDTDPLTGRPYDVP